MTFPAGAKLAWCTWPCPSAQLSLSYIGVRSVDVSDACERSIGRISLEMSDHWQKKRRNSWPLEPTHADAVCWEGRPRPQALHFPSRLCWKRGQITVSIPHPRGCAHTGAWVLMRSPFPKAEHCSTKPVWQSRLWCLLSAGRKCNSWPHARAGVQTHEVGTLSVLLGQWQPGTRN